MKTGRFFSGIKALTMVVRDLRPVVCNYADGLAVGPWSLYDSVSLAGPELDGAPWIVRAAICQLPGTELRLVQPISKTGRYAQFLETHGNGLMHIVFEKAGEFRMQELLAQLAACGDTDVQLMHLGRADVLYVNAPKALGYAFMVEMDAPELQPTAIYPVGRRGNRAQAFSSVEQICCGLDDAYGRVHNSADLFDMQPWTCLHLTPEVFFNGRTKKVEAYNDYHIGLFDGYSVQIEYTAPRAAGSFQAQYLVEHGALLHHIAVGTDDHQLLLARMRELQAPVISVEYVGPDEISYFVDARMSLGCFFQVPVRCRGKGGPITQAWQYPPTPMDTGAFGEAEAAR